MRHPNDDVAARLGILLVSASRPGLGLSDPDPGRTLLDWPSDVAALADHLRIERFAVVGRSAGGPFAAACAHALPLRVSSLAIVSGIGQLTHDGARLLAASEFWPLALLRRAAPELAGPALGAAIRLMTSRERRCSSDTLHGYPMPIAPSSCTPRCVSSVHEACGTH